MFEDHKVYVGLDKNLQLFNLVDDIVAGNTISASLFFKTASLGCVYVLVYSFVAYVIFAFKEL